MQIELSFWCPFFVLWFYEEMFLCAPSIPLIAFKIRAPEPKLSVVSHGVGEALVVLSWQPPDLGLGLRLLVAFSSSELYSTSHFFQLCHTSQILLRDNMMV